MTRTTTSRIDAARAAGALLVEECDVPDGMTLLGWRAAQASERRRAADAERDAKRSRGLLRRLAG